MSSLVPLRQSLLHPILGAGRVVSSARYDPVQALFGNGEDGALLWTTLSPMYQDAAATTPATAAADPVGYFGDLSPNGNHALQATDAERPPLGEDAAGLHLSPDGANHWLDFGSSIIGASGARTLAFTGLFSTSPTGTRGAIGVTSSSGYLGRFSGKHAFVAQSGSQYQTPVDGQTEDTIVVRLDGTNITITSSAGTQTFADTNVAGSISRLLCSSGTAGRMAGKARGFLIINRALSDAEVDAYRAWAAAQAGFLRLSNPYQGVDWGGAQAAGLTHAHGTDLATLQDMVGAGYACLGFSNYYPSDPARAYPLTNMSGVTAGDIPAGVVGVPCAEHHSFTDAGGHISAVGSLLSSGTSKVETPPDGTGYEGPVLQFVQDFEDALLYPQVGGLCLNHPKLSFAGVPKACELLDHSPYVLGIEVFNHLGEWNYDGKGWALDTWHDILVSGRRCFGFGSPDHADVEGAPSERKGFNRLLLPASYATMTRSEREQACLEAYYNGHWYVAIADTSPVLTRVSADTSQVTVEFAEACDITFAYASPGDAAYSETEPVTGTTATYTLTGNEVYVRAVGTGSGADDISLTQPIMFNARPRPLS